MREKLPGTLRRKALATDNIGGEVKETVKILPFMSGWSRLLRKRSEEVTSVSVVVVGQMLF